MLTINLSADDVWEYHQNNKAKLENTEHILAENDEYGIVIALTSDCGLPCFIVTADDYQCEEEIAVSANDCRETAKRLYDDYLTDKFITDSVDYDEIESVSQDDMITERERELDDAIITLLDTIIEDDIFVFLGNEAVDVCDDLKEHILEYLYKKHKISARRPMILEDYETGEDFFDEYPYDSMVFDDEDDYMYKS